MSKSQDRTRDSKREANEKRKKAHAMYIRGATYQNIADVVGYSSRQQARAVVKSMLDAEAEAEREQKDADALQELKQSQTMRYMWIYSRMTEGISNGDTQAAKAAITALMRVDKINGIEQERIDLTTKGEKIQAYDYGHAIAAIAARPDEDSLAPREDKSNRDGAAVGKNDNGG